MKAPSAGNPSRGFSVLEMMIAFTIMTIVLAGVVLADFGAQYWTITSQTSNEALYKAKTGLEDLRAAAKRDFYSAVSLPFHKAADSLDPRDAECLAGGLCYYLETAVTDISDCSKFASSTVSWQVGGYPTSTAALSTTFSSASEALRLGGDCSINYPGGAWGSLAELTSQNLSPRRLAGTPTSIDSLNDLAYVAESTSPFLEVAASYQTSYLYGYASPDHVAINDVDVARDLSTGRTYAFAATASTTQFEVIDVTDPGNMTLVAALPLAGVATTTPATRVFVYDRIAYVTIPGKSTGPEFHAIDVGYPALPTEIGSGFSLGNTTVTGIAVREQYAGGAKKRFAYLATTHTGKEVRVLDVTDPGAVSELGACDVPGAGEGAASLALLGSTLYVGLDVPSGQSDLFAFDASDPAAAAFCTPLPAAADVDSGGSSRHAAALRASGPYLFAATDNTTPSRGEIQVRASDPRGSFELLGAFTLPSTENLVDIDYDSDANRLYAASASTGSAPSMLRVFSAP